VINLSGGDLSQLSEEQRAKLRMLGIDPMALAAQQGAAPAAPPPASDDDQLARLERLVALHEKGALTDQEFAEQKRRILDAD
jgi:Short C-terminal domain